ncbi:PP2C family protein-serine/threonine phosphatase [Streptomyces sp. NPDC002619]|uniref:PP2C family protein-serine/threonine phosphatase n=1 Tax=Streptomyces sp. NPDC002619 TaxID=3364655 RepID=UPI0036985FBD
MSVHVKEPMTPRRITFRSLRQRISPKRLLRRMRHVGQPFEWMLLAPLLVIALTGVTDVLTPHLQFNRLLGAAPALAAAMWPVAGTLAIGLLAFIAAIGLSAAANHDLGQTPSLFTLLAITAITLAAAYASRVRQHRERTLAEVRTVAETAQQVLLRPLPRHLGSVDIELLYQATAAHAQIGGDFYEARQTQHGVRLIIGDVRGKGLPAVEAASVVLSSFRVNVREAPDLADLAARLETSMNEYCEDLASEDAMERFVTTLLVEIPAGQPIARLVNCGHPPPLLLHGGEVREVESSAPSPPVNMAALLGAHYQVDVVPFTVGDRLLLYTDGVSESRDLTGTFYPLSQRIRRWSSATPRQLLDHLQHDLCAYVSGARDDDLTALVAHRVAPGGRGEKAARTVPNADLARDRARPGLPVARR